MGAEERLMAYLASNPAAAAEWARDHKLTNAPRINRFGKFLRKTSLDELPKYGVAAGVYPSQKLGTVAGVRSQ